MSDDIPVDLCNGKMNASFRLPPTEVWTDVFKLLPRHILVKRVQPVNHWFKEICDKNVRCVHLITNANSFNYSLKMDEPEAKQQLDHLTANKCALAGQFRLIYVEINHKNWDAIFRHCSDLLRGCRIAFDSGSYPWHSSFKPAFIAQLEQLEPVSIKLELLDHAENNLLDQPTVWKCNRLSLDQCQFHTDNQLYEPSTFKNIHKWLHRRHDQLGEEIRFMNLHLFSLESPSSIDWLLDQCIQDFKQSGKPTDRRKFVLNITYFEAIELANKFDRIENHLTGEVLLLQLLPDDQKKCCLRRCLAEEVEGQKEFYEKMFKWDGYRVEFNDVDELKTTKVWVY